ncbi:unnamed protein product, partial [Ectocarpus sp. 12 AP-2014]
MVSFVIQGRSWCTAPTVVPEGFLTYLYPQRGGVVGAADSDGSGAVQQRGRALAVFCSAYLDLRRVDSPRFTRRLNNLQQSGLNERIITRCFFRSRGHFSATVVGAFVSIDCSIINTEHNHLNGATRVVNKWNRRGNNCSGIL